MNAAQALAACAEITRSEARNFYYGLRLLPERQRVALYAVYAWMRVLDDLADNESRTPADKDTALARFEAATRAVLAGGAADGADAREAAVLAGLAVVVAQDLERLSALCEVIYVDFDIDVIDRSQWPASPGARPGGVSVQDFFDATRVIGAHPKVRAVDLTEYDPSLEIGDLGSLTAGRWFCELLAGFQGR